MLFDEDDEILLKTWLERTLSKLSDAEAPILAEYCIALLKHDQNEKEVRALCVDQLGDFLKGDTEAFVSDVFRTIKARTFVSVNSKVGSGGMKEPSSRPAVKAVTPQKPEPSAIIPKRNPVLEQRELARPAAQLHHTAADQSSALIIPLIPQMPQLPQLPPMPTTQIRNRKRKHCFAFERDGFCSRGTACPYEHLPPPRTNFHEYDPAFSEMGPGLSPAYMPTQITKNQAPRNDVGSRASHDKSRSTLVVSKVPPEALNEFAVRSFFLQFGEVQYVTINSREHQATVQFSDRSSANAAFCSPMPIFNNRFVKVAWQTEKDTSRDKRRTPVETGTATVAPVVQVDSETIAVKQHQHEERLARKAELERRAADLMEQKAVLEKRQQEQAAIWRQMQTKEQGHLDKAETSTNTLALRSQLDQLKSKAAALGVTPPDIYSSLTPLVFSANSQGRGATPAGQQRSQARGGYRGRGQSGPYTQRPRSLDLRPKGLRIKNITKPVTEVEATIRQLCEYESITREGPDALVVMFKTRHEAEAFSVNRSLGEMNWVTSAPSTGPPTGHRPETSDDAMDVAEETFDRYRD